MRYLAVVLIVALGIGCADCALADSITFDFENESLGAKGTSYTFTSGGFSIKLTHASSFSVVVASNPSGSVFKTRSLLFLSGLITLDITAPAGHTVVGVSIQFADGWQTIGDVDVGSATAWSAAGGTGTSLDTDTVTYAAVEAINHPSLPSTVATLSLSATGIASVTFSSVGTYPNGNTNQNSVWWDNITIWTTAPVPEPGTLALLGLGLAGVVLGRRRSARA